MPKRKGRRRQTQQPPFRTEAERNQYLLDVVNDAIRRNEDEELPITIPMTVLPERCLAPIPAGRPARRKEGQLGAAHSAPRREPIDFGGSAAPALGLLAPDSEEEALIEAHMAANPYPDEPLRLREKGSGAGFPRYESYEDFRKIDRGLEWESRGRREEAEYSDYGEEDMHLYSADPIYVPTFTTSYSVEAPSEDEYGDSEEEDSEAELSEYGEEETYPCSAYYSHSSRPRALYSVEAPSEEEMEYSEEGEEEEHSHASGDYSGEAPSEEGGEVPYQSDSQEESDMDFQEEGSAATPRKRHNGGGRNKRHARRGTEAKSRQTAARYRPPRPPARRARFRSSKARKGNPGNAEEPHTHVSESESPEREPAEASSGYARKGKPAASPTASSARGRVAPPPAGRRGSDSQEAEAAKAAPQGVSKGGAKKGKRAVGPTASSARGKKAPPTGTVPAAQEGSAATGPSPFWGWGAQAGMPGNLPACLSSFVCVPVTVFVFVPLFPWCVIPVPVTVQVLVPRTVPNLLFPSMFPGMVR